MIIIKILKNILNLKTLPDLINKIVNLIMLKVEEELKVMEELATFTIFP